MAFPPPPYRLPLHRNHRDELSISTWNDLASLAGVTGLQPGDKYTDVWNRIATSLGMPAKTGADTVTADEWNEAVNRATARHA